MGTNDLKITICTSVEEAPHYSAPEYHAAELKEVVIVKKGTQAGSSTVDLIFVDQSGQKYITMITTALLKTALDANG